MVSKLKENKKIHLPILFKTWSNSYYNLGFTQRCLHSGYKTVALILLRQQFDNDLKLLQRKFTFVLYIIIYFDKKIILHSVEL